MRRLALTVAALAAGLATAVPVQAKPMLQPGPMDNAITLIEGGCGPGGHRNPYGYCVPNYYGRPEFRPCPYGFHLNPYGRCRPNY